jgi:hypothetical protein
VLKRTLSGKRARSERLQWRGTSGDHFAGSMTTRWIGMATEAWSDFEE